MEWLEESEKSLDSELEIANDPDKIKTQLAQHKVGGQLKEAHCLISRLKVTLKFLSDCAFIRHKRRKAVQRGLISNLKPVALHVGRRAVVSLLSKNHSIVIPGLTVKTHTAKSGLFLLSKTHEGFPEVEHWHFSLSQLPCLVISFIAMQKVTVYGKECRLCHIDSFKQCSGENWLPPPKLVLLCMCVKFHLCPQRDMVTSFLVQTGRYGNTAFCIF